MKEITLNEKSPLSKAIPKKVINVEMFRAGEQTDSDGDRALFTEQDLEDIISTYSPATHEAPLIVGHDQDDSTPSLGWVREMWRKGKSLWGKIELTPKAEKLISEGVFKKVSSSFYAPEADANPYPGKLALRHLALVNIPAVKGLADFKEHLTETINVDFSDQRSHALFKELLDKNTSIMAKPRKKRISNHAEGPMHVTINVGGSSGPEDLPIYDDGGNQLSKGGIPVDYEDDETEFADGDPDFPQDFPEEDEELDSEYAPEGEDVDFGDEEIDEAMGAEGEEAEGFDPEAGAEDMEGMEGEEGAEELDPEAELEGEEELDPEAEPEDVEGSDEIEDISDDVEGDDAKISELASNFSALELAKALMLQKETKNMMESENTSDFSECDEDTEKSKKKKKKEEQDESEDYAEDYEEGTEFAEDGEDEDDESEDYAEDPECSDDEEEGTEFAEDDEDEDEDDEDEPKSKSKKKKMPEFLKKGKKEAEFEESDEDSEDNESLKQRVARLEKELTEQKKLAREKDISDFCEKVYQGGKLTEQIVSKTDMVRFMSSLNGKNSMNFSEGNKRSQFDFFSDVLENLPQLVNFSEVAPQATAPKKKQVAAPESGYAYEGTNLDLHAKALDYSEAKGVDYLTALKSVIDE